MRLFFGGMALLMFLACIVEAQNNNPPIGNDRKLIAYDVLENEIIQPLVMERK